jgi:hypothetical protein
MKIIIPIFVLLLGLAACVTTKFNCEKDIQYLSNTVSVQGASKKELYLRAKYYIYTNYNSPNHVIKWDDTEYNRITLSAKQDVDAYKNSREFYGDVHYDLDIQFKEGKFHYYMLLYKLVMNKSAVTYMMSCSNAKSRVLQDSWENFRINAKKVCKEYSLDPFLEAMQQPYIQDF